MLARHVSDLTGPSSGAFVYKLHLQIWYVVIRVLRDTSSRYEVVGRTLVGLHIYYKLIHGPYNIKLLVCMLAKLNLSDNFQRSCVPNFIEIHFTISGGLTVDHIRNLHYDLTF